LPLAKLLLPAPLALANAPVARLRLLLPLAAAPMPIAILLVLVPDKNPVLDPAALELVPIAMLLATTDPPNAVKKPLPLASAPLPIATLMPSDRTRWTLRPGSRCRRSRCFVTETCLGHSPWLRSRRRCWSN
jgi:hypothetical protein